MKTTIFIGAAMLLMTGCSHTEREETVNADFETMTVTKSDIHLEQTYPASIEGRQSVKIIPRVEGYLRETRVKEGQEINMKQ